MPEFFIVTRSFAAPFMSDTGEHYAEGATPRDAIERVRGHYTHPAGLYFAGHSPDHFEIDRQHYYVDNPKDGEFTDAPKVAAP